MPSVRAVLTDIEGTTTPIRFVHDTLFPYARQALPALLQRGGPEVDAALAEVRQLAPGTEPLHALLGWMDGDAKVTPLKLLQGLAWRQGYADGALQGEIYPDVAPCLRAWAANGIELHVYSSGSEEAQRLIFGYSTAGNLVPLFAGFFDTRVGAKRVPASYAAIAAKIGLPPESILFLSDVEAELDAAAAAGMPTCQLVRAGDGTVASGRHPNAADFPAVARRCALPG